jgi:aminobenzoyl-glutamate utilization protein B
MRKTLNRKWWVSGMVLCFVLFCSWLTASAAALEPGKQQVSDWVDGNKDRMIRLSDAIWSYAELGMQEHRSVKALTDFLRAEGFKVETGVAGMPTAIRASWGNGKPGVGFVGEYDALPMIGNKAVPKKEAFVEGAPGHGCGHNLNGTAGVAAAAALKSFMEKNNGPGSVYFFGTPAEESVDAKVFMLEAGVFNDADVLLMFHSNTDNRVDTGTNLAMFETKFQFKGKTAHGARPHTGRSALDAIELMNAGVNFMREHIPMESRIHYVITKGGVQPNVVPDFAESWYYIRHPKIEEAERIYNWIIDIGKGAALMTQTTFSYETGGYNYNKLNNVSGARIMYENLRLFGVPTFTQEEIDFAKALQREVKAKELGINTDIKPFAEKGELAYSSSDIGAASWAKPFVQLGMAVRIEGAPGHTWADVALDGMSIGHKFMLQSSRILAATGVDIVMKPEGLKKMQAEFQEQTKDFQRKKFSESMKPRVEQYKAEAAQWDKLLQPYYKNP